jgi:hypothetical protein
MAVVEDAPRAGDRVTTEITGNADAPLLTRIELVAAALPAPVK